MSATTNKTDNPTYLSNNDEYLIARAADIEGGHDIHLESHALSDQSQRTKAARCWHSDNDILRMSPLKHFRKAIKHVN